MFILGIPISIAFPQVAQNINHIIMPTIQSISEQIIELYVDLINEKIFLVLVVVMPKDNFTIFLK